MSTKKTRAPSKNSNKNSKGSKDEVPTTSKDKSSTPSRSPDKDTSFRPTVSRDKDSLRPTVSVSREEFIALRDAVELLKNRSTPNSVQSGPSEKRSAAEAFDLDDTSVTVQSGPSKKRTAAEAFDLDDSESDNDRESFSDSESEFDQFFVQDDRCGDAINDKLAGKVNNALLVSPEKEMLTDLLAKHPRPKNVPNLKLPKVNNEVKIVNKPVKFREGRLGKAQNCVEKGLTVVLQIFSKSKLAKGKKSKILDANETYSEASDATKLLVTVHKELSQLRRENLRSSFSHRNRNVCNAQLYEKIEDNELLFGKDIAKKIEEVNRMKKFQSSKKTSRGVDNFVDPKIPLFGSSTPRIPKIGSSTNRSTGGTGRQGSRARGNTDPSPSSRT